MTNFALDLRAACPVCGYRAVGMEFRQFRINKRSIRSTDVSGIVVTEGWCNECRHPLDPQLYTYCPLAPDQLATIAAYRRRKGWDA